MYSGLNEKQVICYNMLDSKPNILFAKFVPPVSVNAAGGSKRWTFSPSCTSIAVIGILQAILSLMALILFAFYIRVENDFELIKMMNMAHLDSDYLPEVKIGLVVLVIIAFLHCTFSIMIVFGAAMNQPRLLLPWLIFIPIVIIVSYVMGVVVALATNSDEFKTESIIRALLFCTLSTLVVSYKTFIVYSLYRHLKRLNF